MLKRFLDTVTIQLRHNREAQGLSQQQLASLLNIGLRSYQRYENGESTPPIDFLFQASKILKFEIKDLFDLSQVTFENTCFKLYLQEDADQFKHHELVKKSGLLDIPNSSAFGMVRKTNQIEEMIKDDSFMTSPYPLSVSTPKFTVVNLKLKELTQQPTHIFPTHIPHRDKIQLGRIWAKLIEKNPVAFDHQMILPDSSQSQKATGKYLFENHYNKYYIIGVLEITQS